MKIRPARADEVGAVRAVWAAASSPATVTDDDASVALLLARDPEALLVAEDEAGGSVVGTLVAAWDGWRGNLYRVAVVPERRRQGIALALVREGERRLQARGARRLAAIVLDEEAHATGFWAAAGYARDDRVRRFVKNL